MIINEIVGLFSTDFNRLLTINQMAKILKKSYASINGHVKVLIQQKILLYQKVGPAILCSLNYENPIAIGHLTLYSLSSKFNTNKRFEKEEIYCAFSVDSKIYYFTFDKKIKIPKGTVCDDVLFRKIVMKRISSIKIIKGHECFWNKIRDIIV